jgi:hypothetical protein
MNFTLRAGAVALLLLPALRAALPLQTAFSAQHTEQTWTLSELGAQLPSDWAGFDFLVVEFKASSSQRFDLGIDTEKGRISKRIGPFAGVWVRASIPLRFYRDPPGSAVDLAATFNQPRSSYWINISGKTSKSATTGVRSLTVAMSHPAGEPTLAVRAVSLAKTDAGDAVLEGKPLIDEFGQYTHAEWPGKAHSLAELKKAWTAESDPPMADRCEYGGFASTKAKATGFFRVEQVDGRWWFVCPDGHLFFSTGLNGVGFASGTRVQGREDLFAALPPREVNPSSPAGARGGRSGFMGGSFYTWNLQRRFGDDWRAKWADFTARRLTAWGFNSIHYWGPRNTEPGAEPHVPYAQMLRGWQAGNSIMGMPDVYAEDFAQRVDEAAASQLGPHMDDKWMLGYFIGNEPPWPGRESQLVDLVLAGAEGPMKQRLKAHLAAGDTPERRREFVHAAFARYLDVIAAACRKYAPNHLNLGIRFGGSPHDDLVKLMRGKCDVFSINIYRYAPPRTTLDKVYELTGSPILIGEFHIGAPERGLASGLVQAANQEERGVAYRYYVEQAASHPALIGAHWFQWLDQPVTGRNDGENYNIGFVDVTDQPYTELVAAAKLTHERLLAVHRGDTAPVTRRPRAALGEAAVE